MQHLRRADDVERQIARSHAACGRTRAQVTKLVTMRAVRDEIHAGMRVAVNAYAARIDTFVFPQLDEHPPEGIVADTGHVRGAGAEPRCCDHAIGRVAAETLQEFVGRASRLIEFDKRLAQRDQVEAHFLRHQRCRAANPAANSAATARTFSALAPGVYRFEPVPNPFAPAVQYAAMLSGRTPPTANTSASLGRTARHALSAAGGSCSAGNILSPSAPASSAAKASVGVATPGTHASPARLASRTTAPSACGMTISRPPASATRATAAGLSTVPAPVRQRSPKISARSEMLAK